MLVYTKKLEAASTNNTTSRKANVAESDYLQPYSPSDEYYDDEAELSTFMVNREGDVGMIHEATV